MKPKMMGQALLAAWLVALEPLIFSTHCASAQVIAGGLFSNARAGNVAGTAMDVPNTNKLALWQGTEDGSIWRWRGVAKTDSFSRTDLFKVFALAFVPALDATQGAPLLFIGGNFEQPQKAALLRRPMTGPLGVPEDFRYFCKEDARTTHASVFALQTAGSPSHPESMELFVGGDFTWTESRGCGQVATELAARYVARYRFVVGEDTLEGRWESLPPDDSKSAAGAPDSPVHMLAFDQETRILYVGGSSGCIRKYRFPGSGGVGIWSVLDAAVGIGSSSRPLAILFDNALGLGFLAFAGAAEQEDVASKGNGVRVFARGTGPDLQERAVDGFPHLEDSPVHFSALVLGTMEGRRVVFAAGNDSHCPTLRFLPLDGRSPAGWQGHSLSASGPCASPNIPGEDIVQGLAFVEKDAVLILAGNFHKVSGQNVSNIALSRDGGRSWSSLPHEGLSEGLAPEQRSGQAVRAILAVPPLDVDGAGPRHASPLGGALITFHGAGFTLPRRKEDLALLVGDTQCVVQDWVSDSIVTCRLAPGFGANLLVEAGLSEGHYFTRKGFRFSYSAPLLGDDGVLSNPASVSVGGDSPVTFLGRHFGRVPATQVQVKVGQSVCDSPRWLSDSSLSCTVAPAASSGALLEFKTRRLPVTAVIGGRAAEDSGLTFSYSPPAVTHVIPSLVPTTGMAEACVTLLGESFGGKESLLSKLVVKSTDCLADHACAGWISDTSVSCPAPGQGIGAIPIAVQVASQTCVQGCSQGAGVQSSLLKYSPPNITKVMAGHLPPRDGGDITIWGSGFGPGPGEAGGAAVFSRTVHLGASECNKVNWMQDDFILCNAAPGAGDKLRLKVEVGGQVGEAEQDLKYQDPVLTDVRPLLLPRDGGVMVTVRGSFFASDPRQYDAVWIQRQGSEENEHAGVVVSIAQLPDDLGWHASELLLRTPLLPATGPASLSMRAGGSDTEYKLEPECEPESNVEKCMYFTERSPVITCTVAVVRGPASEVSGGTGSVAFNLTSYMEDWKWDLSTYLNMPRSDMIYIKDAAFAADVGERAIATNRELQRAVLRLREAEEALKVEFLILSRPGDDWSYQAFLDALRASFDSATGRQELRTRLGIRTLAVGQEPAQPTVETADGTATIQVPSAQEGFTCVGGSYDGLPCAGNASSMTPTQAELACPGGGTCVFTGGLGGGISASWSLGAILGAFVVAGMAAVAVGMKVSADHRRKKRIKASKPAARDDRPQRRQERSPADTEEEDVA